MQLQKCSVQVQVSVACTAAVLWKEGGSSSCVFMQTYCQV